MGRRNILEDRKFAEAIPKSERCRFCGGTGNELYAMYKACRACGGDGRTKGNEQPFLDTEKEETKPKPCFNCGAPTNRWARINEQGVIHRDFDGQYVCDACIAPGGMTKAE